MVLKNVFLLLMPAATLLSCGKSDSNQIAGNVPMAASTTAPFKLGDLAIWNGFTIVIADDASGTNSRRKISFLPAQGNAQISAEEPTSQLSHIQDPWGVGYYAVIASSMKTDTNGSYGQSVSSANSKTYSVTIGEVVKILGAGHAPGSLQVGGLDGTPYYNTGLVRDVAQSDLITIKPIVANTATDPIIPGTRQLYPVQDRSTSATYGYYAGGLDSATYFDSDRCVYWNDDNHRFEIAPSFTWKSDPPLATSSSSNSSSNGSNSNVFTYYTTVPYPHWVTRNIEQAPSGKILAPAPD